MAFVLANIVITEMLYMTPDDISQKASAAYKLAFKVRKAV